MSDRSIDSSSRASGNGLRVMTQRDESRDGLHPDEVDVAAFDVGRDELHAHLVTDLEALAAAHDLAFHGRPEDARPRALLRCTGHDPVEALADARLEEQRRRGFAHEALDLVRGVLLLGAMEGEADRKSTRLNSSHLG